MSTSVVGLIVGLLVALVIAVGGFTGFLLALVLGALGYAAGAQLGGDVDLRDLMRGRRE